MKKGVFSDVASAISDFTVAHPRWVVTGVILVAVLI